MNIISFSENSTLNPRLLSGISLFQPSERRIAQSRESKRQLVPDIGTFASNERGNRPSIPGDLHPESSTQEAKTESSNGAPAKWQQLLLAPRVEIIPAHLTTPEEEVLLENYDNVDYSPVPNDTQECLQSSFWEEPCCAASNDNCSNEPERD